MKQQQPKEATKKSGKKSGLAKQILADEKANHVSSYRHMKSLQKTLIDKATGDYNALVCDPLNSPECRSITTNGGYPGQTAVFKLKARFPLALGTQGYGYCIFDPQKSGPCLACDFAEVSGITYTGDGSSAPGGAAGTGKHAWADAPFTRGNSLAQLQGRCIAAAIYITPTGSMTTQSGTINLLEVPGHTQGTVLTLGSVIAHPRTRLIRGAQLGDTRVQNVLNFHPQKSFYGSGNNQLREFASLDDFVFRSYPTPEGAFPYSTIPLIAVLTGTPGLTFEIQVVAVYEAKGSLVKNLAPAYVSPMGEAILWNAYAHKTLSGWNATSPEARESYAAATVHTAKKLMPAVKDAHQFGSEILDFAKSVGGFLGF